MPNMKVAALIVLWTVCDLVVTYSLLRSKDKDMTEALKQGYTHTAFDLFPLSIARAMVLFMWLLLVTGVACRGRRDLVRHVLLVLLVVLWMYNGGKVLAVSDHPKIWADRYIIAAFAWSCAACMLSFGIIFFMKAAEFLKPLSDSVSDLESKPLLDHSSDSHHVAEKGVVNSGGRSSKCSALYRLAHTSVPDLPLILLGTAFLIFTVICEMLIPYYMGRVIEGLVIDQSQDTFHSAIIRLAAVAAMSVVCTWVRIWAFSMYVARITARVRQRFFASVIAKDLDFFDTVETGDLVSRLMADVAVLGDSLSPNLDEFLKGVFTAVGVMGFMVQASWRLSVLTVLFLPAFVIVAVVYGFIMKKIGISSQSIMAVMGEMAEENFSNIRTVRSFATEEDEVRRFDEQVRRLFCNGKTEAWTHSSCQSMTWFFRVALRVCILLYGGHLVHRALLSGGDLLTVILYLEKINVSIVTISAVYGGMMKGLGASEILFEHIDRTPRNLSQGAVVKGTFRGEIEFRNVTFSYPSRPHQTILSGMSFRVQAGEVVALVGPSGGGKSTCVSLLQNFYRPDSGQILLDGIPVQNYTHRNLHSKMTMVGQEPALFSRSLKENIAYGLTTYTDAEVISAAKQAHAHEFITLMREGYDTSAGERGLQLSGGQKQRLAIARALVRDPAILILDEATSALDAQSEAKVQEALSRSVEGRTVLVIAHRLSTVEAADRVLVVSRGRVVEEGPPSYLLSLGGLYSSLVRKQVIGTGSQSLPSLHHFPQEEDEPKYENLYADEDKAASVTGEDRSLVSLDSACVTVESFDHADRDDSAYKSEQGTHAFTPAGQSAFTIPVTRSSYSAYQGAVTRSPAPRPDTPIDKGHASHLLGTPDDTNRLKQTLDALSEDDHLSQRQGTLNHQGLFTKNAKIHTSLCVDMDKLNDNAHTPHSHVTSQKAKKPEDLSQVLGGNSGEACECSMDSGIVSPENSGDFSDKENESNSLVSFRNRSFTLSSSLLRYRDAVPIADSSC